MCACSLDREPKDPTTVTTFDQDAVFTKIYATFGTTGQQGPSGDGDVDGIDEGTSAFYRMFWELNEFCTDEGWWIWNDVGLAEIRTQEWTKTNDLVTGLYYRLYFDITLCNHFLDMTKGATDEKTLNQIAEVRMIRAINYYYLLDMFCGVPLCETVSPDHPKPVTRKELFRWLEAECKDLCGDDQDIDSEKDAEFHQFFANDKVHAVRPYGNDLPQTRATIYQVDRSCAWFILMRMYLNKTVYYSDKPSEAGVPDWHSAAWYASRVIKESGRKLLTGDAAACVDADTPADIYYTYSAYQKLFMGDNNTNGAQDEALLMIYQDANHCQSWGNGRFLVNATRDGSMLPSGSSDSWSCFRSSPEFVYYFIPKAVAEATLADEYHMPVVAGDDRAILCSNVEGSGSTWKLSGGKAADFYASWAVAKWTGIYSTSQNPFVWTSPVGVPDWVDTDIPLFRVAEAYLTYAEAVTRGGNEAQGLTAKGCVDALRERAHASTDYTLNLSFLLEEWAREMHAEGHRRCDLVRYGQFAGDKASMMWEGHTTGLDAKFNVYPIPESDETANPNLAGLNAAIGY